MSAELEMLRAWWQPVLNQIVSNMHTMTDSKGHNRYASGNTAQEITVANQDILTESLTEYIVTLTFPMHAIYIDEGVAGYNNLARTTGQFSFKRNGKQIPTKAIRSFMLNRGIVPRDETGKRVKLKDPEKQLNAIAYLIAKKIKRDGIDMVPFISSVINEELIQKYKRYVGSIFAGKVRQEIVIEFESIYGSAQKTF